MKILNRHHLQKPWPAGAVYVGRGHPLGNPFRIGPDGDRAEVIEKYRDWLTERIEAGDRAILAALRTLREDTGLVCSCAPAPCHAEVIRDAWHKNLPQFIGRRAVFVFGSNLAGRHGAGAARYAAALFGAIAGVGAGPTGDAYAIPTKDAQLGRLTVDCIAHHARQFIHFAAKHPDIDFLLTPIGTGLAKYPEAWIAPLFAGLPDNVFCTGAEFARLIPNLRAEVRLIIAGSRTTQESPGILRVLDRALEKLASPSIEVVCGGARGADQIGRNWAYERGLRVREFPAPWGKAGKAAGYLRNTWMAAYGTHLLTFWDGRSPGTRHMIRIANSLELRVHTVNIDSVWLATGERTQGPSV